MKSHIGVHQAAVVLLFILFATQVYSQGILNNGGKITLASGSLLTLTGSGTNFVNASLNGDGTVDNNGTIYLQGNFTNAASGGEVFINADSIGTVEFNGSGACNISGIVSFENLKINNSSGVSLQNNNSITKSLTLTQGLLEVNGYLLTMANDAVIYRTGGDLSDSPVFDGMFDVVYNQFPSQIESGYELTNASDKIRDLTINSSNGVSLQKSIIVNRKLNFNSGKIDINQHNLVIAPEAVITGYNSSKYIIAGTADYESEGGRLTRFITDTTATAKTVFPIGTATSYTPCYISTTSATGTNYNVNVFEKVMENGTTGNEITSQIVKRTWDIVPDAVVGETTVKLQWNDADEAQDIERNSVSIWRNHHLVGEDEAWLEPGGTLTGQITTSPYWVAIDGITSFSNFAISSKREGNSPLPMSLISFSAVCNGGQKALNWTTATETNNDFFTIERSRDAKTWEFVEHIDGAGNSNSLLRYSAFDENPYNSLTYYRLKQTDFDGRFSYSEIITSESCGSNAISDLSVYPNPFKDDVTVSFTSTSTADATINIITSAGDLVYSKPFQVVIGENKTSLHLTEVESGTYFVYVSSVANVYFKIVKQ